VPHSNSRLKARVLASSALMAISLMTGASAMAADASGLLFYQSGDKGLKADIAGGEADPNFASNVSLQKDDVPNSLGRGAYIQAQGTQVLNWMAPGNIYAERGTLSFYWRARDPVGPTAFPIFRVAYADHTSWDMTWLRIDWNGKGFDAFVTDNNLSRVRVSSPEVVKGQPPYAADKWILITFAWDETSGVSLYIDGRKVAAKAQTSVLAAGLDSFGPHSRLISPHQVQSMYQFIRGGDIDDIRIYDHALSDADVSGLAAGKLPTSGSVARDLKDEPVRKAWLHRYGWDRAGDAPVYLSAAQTTIRKVEFAAQYDHGQRMTAGGDGIPETTWPGVYNRSKLTGRHDYFELPDWNTYVEGGKVLTLTLPDEPFNHLELTGAAFGKLSYAATRDDKSPKVLERRAAGIERSSWQLPALKGGVLSFANEVQETPIQEIAAYNITSAAEPAGLTLSYKVNLAADIHEYPALDALKGFVNGRYPADERTLVAALPAGVPTRPAPKGEGAAHLPIVHILIPEDLRGGRAGRPFSNYEYGWEGINAGLDGIAIDLPALKVVTDKSGLIPLNIKVKDPLWPGRDMLDVNISVKAGEARTVFLDTRDRILPEGKSLYLSIAGADDSFDASQLDGMAVRLKFKPYEQAATEHVADRFDQASDNYAFLIEERTATKRLSRFVRLNAELEDVLKVDRLHQHARELWAELYPEQGALPVTLPEAPAGVPKWAFLQVEDLKRVRQFVEWWIDKRQDAYGDFGGGISDDDDLTQQWPPLALMGDIPDKVTASLNRLVDAGFKNGMITDGFPTIKTDELHTYEEIINGESEAMYINFGDPKAVERLMATAASYPKIIRPGKNGLPYVISRYFSATSISLEPPWDWSHAYSPLILHPGILLSDYNANPTLTATITGLADNYLSHAKPRADGVMVLPEELNWQTGAARGALYGKTRANNAAIQLFWAAWRLTGDAKYLDAFRWQYQAGEVEQFSYINGDVIDAMGLRAEVGAKYKAMADKGSKDSFALYQAWRTTGDIGYLEKAYANEIAFAEQKMWLFTEAHWWTDRVEIPSDTLQRARLGGLTVRRNQLVPGHLISWRFDQPTAAEEVGLLVSEPGQTHFKVTGFNMAKRLITAQMTGWGITGGQWTMRKTVDGVSYIEEAVSFERTKSLEVSFEPGKTMTYELTLVKASEPSADRFDLGIGEDDVKAGSRGLSVTVHSLGAKASPPSVLVAEDAAGKEIARTSIPGLEAPLDLKPRTVTVRFKARTSWKPGMRVRILTQANAPEITEMNNTVVAR
jgi:hypothetical protein